MGALPRPDLPPGARRELTDALHDLHHRAGWPSLRRLAAAAGCSHTTVSKAFSSPALPTWGTLELLVEAMGGDVARFHDLWLAASAPPPGTPTGPRVRIAGRRTELAVVRRHLETGSGLMLVTGEAGLGKTALVEAGARLSECFVATGHCLPLSSQVPLLPVADALRGVLEHDDRQWLKEALADCPAYVAVSLATLVPELDTGQPQQVSSDEFSRHRLFVAAGTLLIALSRLRPLVLLLEDLHWADDATLDLVQHLALRPGAPPTLGTWRTDDPGSADGRSGWLARLRREAGVNTIELAALSREETAEQLALVSGAAPDDEAVDRIQEQGQGLPLYTEQLASAPAGSLPSRLSDLLDSRLGDLVGPAWRVARVLGVADRPLRPAVLRDASGLAVEELEEALRGLASRRLLRSPDPDRVAVGHPLLAEAIRRRLVAGESSSVHGRLAELLEALPEAEPGEIARHWQGAGRPEELRWRMAAAAQAGKRYAAREELAHWRRVVELWGDATQQDGMELWEVLCRAIDAAYRISDVDSARDLVARALVLDRESHLRDSARVQVLRRAANLQFDLGDHEAGQQLLDEALVVLRRLPPSPDLVDVLVTRIGNLNSVGRHDEVRADIRRALDMLAEVPDDGRLRRVLDWAAWLEMVDGNPQRAWELSSRARAISLPEVDVVEDLMLAVNATDDLLLTAAPASRVAEAAQATLAEAARWHLVDHLWAGVLRGNVAEAHLRAGDVQAAADVLEPVTNRAPEPIKTGCHVMRAAVELRQGRRQEALERATAAEAHIQRRDASWVQRVPHHADLLLWAGQPAGALDLLDQAIALVLPTDNVLLGAPCVAMWARAHADLAADTGASPADRSGTAARLRSAIAGAKADPFGPRAIGVAAGTFSRAWEAELARLEGKATVDFWAAAAAGWDGLARPHDAAYCRWRAAQVAFSEGRGTVAARLLGRAARGAREHVPLSEAIAKTARSAHPAAQLGGPNTRARR